ncbi:hypothetical protein [Bdellovibrio sp. BCCA]|uniref:hypothetical protein n=1 Tax=Bdellovibrio sp. BCCA TaxID=3136281 RepID=UPI0030F2367C
MDFFNRASEVFEIYGFQYAILGYFALGLGLSYLLSKMVSVKFKNAKYDYSDTLIHKKVSPLLVVLIAHPIELLIAYVMLIQEMVAPLFERPFEAIKELSLMVVQLIGWPLAVPISIFKMYDNEAIEVILNDIKRRNAIDKYVDVSSIIEKYGAKKRRILIALKVASLDQLHRNELVLVAGNHEMAADLIKETHQFMEER